MDNLFRASEPTCQISNEFPLISMESAQLMSLKAQPTNSSKRLFRCTNQDCKKTFLYQSELKRHIQTHSTSRPHVCPHPGCGKGFKRFDTLQSHYRLHTGEKPFICNFPACGLGFPTKAALRYHSLKHSDDKLFKCDVPQCGKAFLTLGQLKQHEKGKCHCSKSDNISDFSSLVSRNSSTLFYPLTAQESMSMSTMSPVAVTTTEDDSTAMMEPVMVKKLKKFLEGTSFPSIDMDF